MAWHSDSLQGVLTRQTLRLSDAAGGCLTRDFASTSTRFRPTLTRGGNIVFLMLCERTVREFDAVDLAQVPPSS